jgi:hypothetical protein
MQAIADILDDENFDDGSLGPVFVRLAWHQAGSYDKATGTGGSNGCTIRFNPEAGFGANAGTCTPRAIRVFPIVSCLCYAASQALALHGPVWRKSKRSFQRYRTRTCTRLPLWLPLRKWAAQRWLGALVAPIPRCVRWFGKLKLPVHACGMGFC